MAYYNGRYVNVKYTGDISAETLREEVANAITETVNGVNAVRLDGVSPIANEMQVISTQKNLMQNPFSDINVENGKTYTFSFKLKDGVTLSSESSYGVHYYSSEGMWQNNELIFNGEILLTSWTFTAGIDGEHGYYISSVGMSDDMFEYVQLEEGAVATDYAPYIENINAVTLKSYGKKLCDDSFLKTLVGTDATNDRNVYVGTFSFPVTITIEIDESKKVGSPYMRLKTDNGYGSAQYLYSSNKVRTVIIDGINNPFGEYYFRYSSGMEQGAITSLQVEAGLTASVHEEYKEPVDGVVAIYPTTTLVADTDGVSITATYNKDTNKVIQELKNAILNLGGTINV